MSEVPASHAGSHSATPRLLAELLLCCVLLVPAYVTLTLGGVIGAVAAATPFVVAGLIAAGFAICGRPEFALVAIAFTLVMQNALIGAFANLADELPRLTTLILIEGKSVLAVTILATLGTARIVRPHRVAVPAPRRRVSTFFVLAGMLALLCLVQALRGQADVLSRLAYMRNFNMPFVYVTIGYLLFRRASVGLSPWRPLSVAVIGVGLWSSVIQLGYRDEWDRLFDPPRLAAIRGPFSDQGGLPGLVVDRAPGIIGEGVNASYMFGSLALLLWVMGRRRTAAFGVLAALLSFGKGGLALLAVGFLLTVTLRRVIWHRRASVARVFVPALLLVGACVAAFIVASPRVDSSSIGLFGSRSSAEIHVFGLTRGAQATYATPVGHGLGAGGNFSNIAAGLNIDAQQWLSSGAESAFGVIGYQLGVLGFGLMAGALVALVAGLFCIATHSVTPITAACARASAGAATAVSVLLFFQENALSAQAAALVFLLGGAVIGADAYDRQSEPIATSGGPGEWA